MTVLRAGSATDVGRVRHTNQDLALDGPDLFAVADGMGGHAGGEVAAHIAIETLDRAFARRPSAEGLRQAITEANGAIWRRSLLETDLRGMGTTLTAAALVPAVDGYDVVVLANVGDSRAYLFSGGQITQVTADHSLAEEKVRQGELTEAEAAVHPQRHILTRALGVAPEVAVDLWEIRLQEGDRLLLCSDGLTNEVVDDQLAEVMGSVAEPQAAADALVALANEHGGADNITVVVVDVLVADQEAAGAGTAPSTAAAVGPAVLGAGAAGAGTVAARGVPGPAGTGDLTEAVPVVRPRDEVESQPPERPPGVPPGPGEASEPRASSATNGARESVVVAPATGREGPPEEGWWARRRQRSRQLRAAGVPRRVTFRVLLFVVLVAAVVVGAYYFVRWYANDNWYVTVRGNQLVVYQGRSGGLLWFQPKIVDHSGVSTSDVLSTRIPALRAEVQEPSLTKAKHYIANLVQEKIAQQQVNNGGAPGPTTTSVPPTSTVPSGSLPAPPGGSVTSTTVVVSPSPGGA